MTGIKKWKRYLILSKLVLNYKVLLRRQKLLKASVVLFFFTEYGSHQAVKNGIFLEEINFKQLFLKINRGIPLPDKPNHFSNIIHMNDIIKEKVKVNKNKPN